MINKFSDIPIVGPVVIGFFAFKWCNECASCLKAFENLASVFPSVVFLIESQDTMFVHSHSTPVQSLPSFSFHKDGKCQYILNGFSINEITKKIHSILE